jgi:glucosamine 6-phosphate synthetase-like amidotransferase/phosphosugar isomerase protein
VFDRHVCGIAGYDLNPGSSVGRTLAAQALLAGIAERGADAVGSAHRVPGGEVVVHKQQSAASALLETVSLPDGATQALVHVRDYTKGHPSILANNHPIRHGAVVGIHNGIIQNDEELFERHGIDRHAPEMTVDSEAIFALVHRHGARPETLEQLHGAMASAWLDERDGTRLHLARGVGRPLWLGTCADGAFFASTRQALEVAEQALRVTLDLYEVAEGTLLALEAGEIVDRRGFRPDTSYCEQNVLPAVRAPQEGRSCLERLAVLAAWA